MCIDWCILYSTVTVVLWVQYGGFVMYHGVGEEKLLIREGVAAVSEQTFVWDEVVGKLNSRLHMQGSAW